MVSEIIIQFGLISLAGILYSVFTIFVTEKIGNRARANEIQKEIKELNEKIKKLQNSKEKKGEEELNKTQEKIPKLLYESMMLQFKPLILTLPALFLLPPFLKSIFMDFTITLGFYLPIFLQNFEHFPNWRNVFGTIGWFWIVFIFSSLIIQLISTVYKKIKKGELNGIIKA
ncbi:DUF106 domain-containing protein [Candidatus Micrarchaeota archaeon]|nr:DUF106 domain-containing protein [Candidatus Micrarchaeota archaeon]